MIKTIKTMSKQEKVRPGEICAFIGHNGAGKTTTLKCCCGIQQFDSGRITVDGISVQDDPLECKRRLAYLPDNPDLYEYTYLVSQSWDVAVFHAIRDRYIAKHGSTKGGRWLWNNGSTITSQIWDTVIYAVISFGFGLGWVHTHEGRMQLIGIIIGQYLLKACLALLDTPFFYFFTRNADRR